MHVLGRIYIVTDTKIASSQLLKKAVNETPPSSYKGVDEISIHRCKKNKAVWRIVVRLWVQAINTQLNDFLNYYFLYMSTMIIFYLRYYIFILVITWVKGRGGKRARRENKVRNKGQSRDKGNS